MEDESESENFEENANDNHNSITKKDALNALEVLSSFLEYNNKDLEYINRVEGQILEITNNIEYSQKKISDFYSYSIYIEVQSFCFCFCFEYYVKFLLYV